MSPESLWSVSHNCSESIIISDTDMSQYELWRLCVCLCGVFLQRSVKRPCPSQSLKNIQPSQQRKPDPSLYTVIHICPISALSVCNEHRPPTCWSEILLNVPAACWCHAPQKAPKTTWESEEYYSITTEYLWSCWNKTTINWWSMC